jgi:hypothetical protein
MRDVVLEIPLLRSVVIGGAKGRNATDPMVKSLGDALNGTPFSRLEDYDQFLARMRDPSCIFTSSPCRRSSSCEKIIAQSSQFLLSIVVGAG